MDQRYLIFFNATIVFPLKRPLKIELYNATYFSSEYNHIHKPSFNKPSCQLNASIFKYHPYNPITPSVAVLLDDSKVQSLAVEPSESIHPTDHPFDSCQSLFSLFNWYQRAPYVENGFWHKYKWTQLGKLMHNIIPMVNTSVSSLLVIQATLTRATRYTDGG